MSNPESNGIDPIKRPLTEQELELTYALLANENSALQTLTEQVSRISVSGQCNCGCPTIYFALDGELVTKGSEVLIRDYLGTVDGDLVGVMLFQRGDKLSSLEVYSCAGTDKPFGLPPIDTLKTFEQYEVEIGRKSSLAHPSSPQSAKIPK